MILSKSNTIHAPLDWTADQAKAIVELLEEIIHTVWDLYGDAIQVEQERQQVAALEKNDHKTDDSFLPF